MRTLTELMDILTKALDDEDYLLNFPYEKDPTLKITCTVWGEEIYPFTRDVGPAEYAEDVYTIEYDYDKDELMECLKTSLQNEEEEAIANLIPKVNEDLLNDFVETFIGSLTEIYWKDVEEYFYDDAQEQAQDEYDNDCNSRRADAEVDRYENSLEDKEQDYYDRVSDLY